MGHSFIKAVMAQESAVFGGEHSAHYYFRDFWFADTGMLAAMHVLAALGGQDGPLSALVSTYDRYVSSGEINSTVADPPAALAAVRSWSVAQGLSLDELDGITATYDGAPPRWWLNVRSSNTEPLVRLNVEADDRATMEQVRDRALAVIRGRPPVSEQSTASIEPWVREILRCPACHSELADSTGPTGSGAAVPELDLWPGLPGRGRHTGAACRGGPPHPGLTRSGFGRGVVSASAARAAGPRRRAPQGRRRR